MKYIYTILLLGFIPWAIPSHYAYAQEKLPRTLIGLQSLTDIFIAYWNEAELQSVDTAYFEATYHLKYRRDSVSDVFYDMLTVVQRGKVKQKYYSMIRQFMDDVQLDVRNQMTEVSPVPGVGAHHQYTEDELHIKDIAGVDWINSEIWINLPSQTLSERAHGFNHFNISLEYEEPIPSFDWHFTEQVDEICGYDCFSATTDFRGRTWTVWYAPEIPVNSGPWKFSGLPGLVLRAHDARMDYSWDCIDVVLKTIPIVYYKVESKILTRDKWRHYIRQVYENPLMMLNENGQTAHFVKGKMITKDDNWQVPYNPIELE